MAEKKAKSKVRTSGSDIKIENAIPTQIKETPRQLTIEIIEQEPHGLYLREHVSAGTIGPKEEIEWDVSKNLSGNPLIICVGERQFILSMENLIPQILKQIINVK